LFFDFKNQEEIIMTKEVKKKPKRTLKEKRNEKKEKRKSSGD